MTTIWVTSDTHFGHENIISYCGRPFSNAKEMDEALVSYWNAIVKPGDHVYHLGDVTMDRNSNQRQHFVSLCRSLNGHKRLLLGNHDHFPIHAYLDAGFEKIYATTRHLENILFSHIPIHPNSMGTARANVHGHIHNSQSDVFKPVLQVEEGGKVLVKPYVNVCVEVTNYHPITLEEVKERITQAVEAANAT